MVRVLALAAGDPIQPARPGDPLTSAFSTLLEHEFARPELLREALTHRSVLGGGGRKPHRKGAGSNERLEFVGDRVLGLLVAEWLVERFPDEQEGELGRRLAALVSQPVLAQVADAAGLAEALAVAPGEARVGVNSLATVLADALEASIGALYLDGGLEPARRFVRRAWGVAMTEQLAPPKDAKTGLQEWAQARGLDLPCYVVAARAGPAHAPLFDVTVAVAGQVGRGSAGSKRAAEQIAAADLMERIGMRERA